MSPGVSHLKWLAAKMFFFVCLGGASFAFAADSALPPAPSTGALFEQSGNKSEIQFELQRDVSGSKVKFPERPMTFDNFLDSSYRPAPMTPQMPMMMNRRAQRWLDEQNNWAFITPEDAINDYKTRGIMGMPEFTPDGRDKSTFSAVERFYDRMARSHEFTNSAPRNDVFNFPMLGGDPQRDPDSSGVFNPLAGVGKNSASTAGLSVSSFDSPSGRPNSIQDFLGKNNRASLDYLRERQSQQDQLDAFKKALEFRPLPVSTPDPMANTGWQNPGIAAMETYNGLNPLKPYDPMNGIVAPRIGNSQPLPVPVPSAPYGVSAAPRPEESQPETLSAIRLPPQKLDFSKPIRRF